MWGLVQQLGSSTFLTGQGGPQPTALQIRRELRKAASSVCISLYRALSTTECTEGGWFSNLSFTSLALLSLRLGLACGGNLPTPRTICPLGAIHLQILGALGQVTLPGQMASHLSSWGIISQPVVHTPLGRFLSSTHMY